MSLPDELASTMPPAHLTPKPSQPLTPDVSTTVKSIFLKHLIELLFKIIVLNVYENWSIFNSHCINKALTEDELEWGMPEWESELYS